MGVPRFFGDQIDLASVSNVEVGVTAGVVPSTGVANAHIAADAAIAGSKLATEAQIHFARGQVYDLDNGAGTTIDDVILVPSVDIKITAARIVYVDATSGTVAAGNVTIGVAVDGEEIVAATAYENGKAVGTTTKLSIVDGEVVANEPICVRHTGVAATAAGKAYIEIEFTITDA